MKTTNSWNRETYIKAWMFATRKHAGQKYGGPAKDEYIDYINHIGMVCMEVIWALNQSNDAYNADLAVQCALLHDTIEDTSTSFEEIKSEFGENVALGVKALSKNGELGSKSQQMEDSLKRIKEQPKEIWMVKLADRISNLNQPPFYWDLPRKKKYLDEATIIFDNLHTANKLLALRLKEKIENYPHFF